MQTSYEQQITKINEENKIVVKGFDTKFNDMESAQGEADTFLQQRDKMEQELQDL